MALKLEHSCTRCGRKTSTEVQDVAAATKAEALDAKRAVVLKDLNEFISSIDPALLPDLFIVRRNEAPVIQMTLCNDENAKRSCADRVAFVVEECTTFDPRKPKTKKTKEASAAPVSDKKNGASASA